MIGAFFRGHLMIEFALKAVAQLHRVGALDLAAAEGPGDGPAGPTAVFAAIDAVEGGFGGLAGQAPNSATLSPPGSRPHFLTCQQFSFIVPFLPGCKATDKSQDVGIISYGKGRCFRPAARSPAGPTQGGRRKADFLVTGGGVAPLKR